MSAEELIGEVAVWPEHWAAVQVFAAMGTQWRVGMGGATGLDYAALPAVMDLLGVPDGRRAEVFAQVRVMEDEALRVFVYG